MSADRAYNKIYKLGFCAVALFLPFGQPAINYSVALLALLFLIPINFSKKKTNRTLLFLPLFFYMIHAIGLLYSNNISYGLLDMETKFSYLLFPLIFFLKPPPADFFRTIKLFFVTGCFVICLYNMTTSINEYFITKNIDSFYYIAFSKVMHVQYLTIYLNISILFILEILLTEPISKTARLLGLLLVVFLLVNVSLLSSRLATVVSYMTIILFIVLKAKGNQVLIKYWAYVLFTLALVIVTDYFVLSHSNRFDQVEILFNGNNDFYKFDKKEYNSATVRIPLWINAAQVIDDNKLLGVGTGDIKEELDSVYRKNKFAYAEASHFSPHNQILHTGIILGFVGITMLLSMLLIPLYYSIRYKSYLLMCFIIIFFFNMMTESILERQAGIILFSFFYVILIAELYKDIKKAEEVPA